MRRDKILKEVRRKSRSREWLTGEAGPAKHKKDADLVHAAGSRYTRPGGARRNGLGIGGSRWRAGAIEDGVVGVGGASKGGLSCLSVFYSVRTSRRRSVFLLSVWIILTVEVRVCRRSGRIEKVEVVAKVGIQMQKGSVAASQD